MGDEPTASLESIAAGIDALSMGLDNLQDLFVRRLMSDKQKAGLIDTLREASQQTVIEPFLHDIILLLDRLSGATDEFSVSIADELFEALYRRGVARIENLGAFDPTVHRVVSSSPSNEVEGATVAQVLRAGYTFNNKVIRFADVVLVIPVVPAKDGVDDADL